MENVLPAYLNVLISVSLVSLVCISTYKGGFLQKLLFSILINALWMFLESLVGYLVMLNGNYYTAIQFLGSLFSKLLTLFLIISLRIFFQNESIRNISNRNNFTLLLIPVGSIFVVYNVFMLSVQMDDMRYIENALTSSVIVFLINAIIFRLYLSLSKEKELQKYNAVYKQQIELCEQHMREKETVMAEFRNARHDIKQHIIVLGKMLDNHESEQAADYLKRLIEMDVLNNTGISRTDNIVVDSLINAKYAVALREKIKFTADIHIPVQLPFGGADISILLGNVLDNAIEASVKIPEEKRYIKCFMKYEMNTLIISVVNAFDGKLLRNRDNKIITTKNEPENHGIGLESVRQVAEKYHGSYVVETKPETFIIKIILCDLP
ncbi:MAG: GHKL domain-containing protein [Lachnospiraceae bacterium]|nr:GHKL domain-containing protein [Lachnospiraceae bacterium]